MEDPGAPDPWGHFFFMSLRLPEPVPAVRSALRLLPHEPGVYNFRDAAGRVLYVGRSRDIASRTRSYWIDLKDRPHLARMLGRVAWLEPVLCASEHEAAFLESDLLERHPTRYNRTLGIGRRSSSCSSRRPRSRSRCAASAESPSRKSLPRGRRSTAITPPSTTRSASCWRCGVAEPATRPGAHRPVRRRTTGGRRRMDRDGAWQCPPDGVVRRSRGAGPLAWRA
jgi:hypothetical protein